MSYQDVLATFQYIHRTRLFDEKWTVVQQWTSVNVGCKEPLTNQFVNLLC